MRSTLYLTGQCRRGSLQNCPFFHKPRAPAGKRAHFVFVYYRSEKRNPYDQNLFQDPHSGGGCADDRPVHRFEHDPDPAHAPRRFHHPVQHGAHSGNELPPRRKVGHHDRFRQQPDPACAGPWQSGILPDPHGTGGLRAAGLPSGLHGAGLCLPDRKAFPQPHRGCRCQRLVVCLLRFLCMLSVPVTSSAALIPTCTLISVTALSPVTRSAIGRVLSLMLYRHTIVTM